MKPIRSAGKACWTERCIDFILKFSLIQKFKRDGLLLDPRCFGLFLLCHRGCFTPSGIVPVSQKSAIRALGLKNFIQGIDFLN